MYMYMCINMSLAYAYESIDQRKSPVRYLSSDYALEHGYTSLNHFSLFQLNIILLKRPPSNHTQQ